MRDFPKEPDLPESEQTTGSMNLRYEDVSQDGRLMLEALTHGFGPTLWTKHATSSGVGVGAMIAQGVLPILTGLILEGGPGPIGLRHPLALRGSDRLAHTVDAAGEIDRLMLLGWVTATGRRARAYGPPPPGAGEPVPVGRAFAEHVFTRLFAAPADRKVRRFEGIEGFPPVPPDRYEWCPPEALLDLPEGAEPLEPAPAPDPAEVAFGVDHTDSNQHVNSLVYPRLFLDAALRRFAALGRPTALIAHRAEIAYRKPCFAGDRARLVLRAFALGERLGAVGAFISNADPAARPSCTVRALFVP